MEVEIALALKMTHRKYATISKGPTLKNMLFFKVVFEKELDLTNVPETLKDELKQVQSVQWKLVNF